MTYEKAFIVSRSDIRSFKTETSENATPLGDGEVLMKVDQFSFTANNITYAAFGDAMKYWDFFPANDGWGTVPVWGFADVVESNSGDVSVGERFYGYFPMSSHLRVTPAKASANGFFDGAAHRQHLSPIYNYYSNTKTDPGYNAEQEALQMLFRPLFMTSFLIDDFLDDNGFYGAKQVVLSSASSRTAYGLAFQLAQRSDIKVIGLTSDRNMAFVEGLGCYDKTVTYDNVSELDASLPTVYVDMAGSGPVRAAVHTHFAENLKYSCSVGASHWDDRGSNEDLPGAKPTLFFAPSQGQKRSKDWGEAGMQQRTGTAWLKFVEFAGKLTTVVESKGEDAISSVYTDTLTGNTNPTEGNILSF
ncbi:MAG: hypothetical protein COB37_11360 [Kordiimonadales bacterium]|nr:MAG: hypothetical protein COB37_11360 [Kordiimonadales bacterium]